MRSLLVFALIALSAYASEDDHDGHDHDGHDHDDHDDHAADGERPYEWAGVFDISSSTSLTWLAQKVDGDYADPTMKIVLLPATGTTTADLQALEEEAEHSFEESCKEVNAGGTLKIAEDTCYQLKFDDGSDDSKFKITPQGSFMAVFAEHVPTEFERDTHYLYNQEGSENGAVEPEAELTAPWWGETPWGQALAAAFVVALCTFIGVIFLVPALSRLSESHRVMFNALTSSFAAGAILAAAFFLILFEATHFLEQPEEAVGAALWGSAILVGFISAFVLDLLVSFARGGPGGQESSPYEARSGANGDVETKDKANSPTESAEPPPNPSRARILCSVLLGDFIHNLCDGIFIGIAFNICGQFGWTVTAATVYHELAQEISDYFVLTAKDQGNLRPWKALTLNFVSGLSVVIGVIIILAQNLDNVTVGLLLAFSGGVYVHLGATECMARVYHYAKEPLVQLAALGIFVLGAVAIGLVLLDHEHCEGGGHDH